MKVFKDYEFLAKYVKQTTDLPLYQQLVKKEIESLNVVSVLDIGGGTTSYMNHLSGKYETTVLDISEESVSNINSKNKILCRFPGANIQGKYDVVSALEVLEHISQADYEESLREIKRLSKRFVVISAPFMQDLSGAYVLCKKCNTEFQCEGHYKSFNMNKIRRLQKHFGKLIKLYFIGKKEENYVVYYAMTNIKHLVRRILQKSIKSMYCKPPFTKCPECNNEIFNEYEIYLTNKKDKSKYLYWDWLKNKKVAGQFCAVYEKDML